MRINVRSEEAYLKRKRTFRKKNKRVEEERFLEERRLLEVRRTDLDDKSSFMMKEDSLRDVRTKMCMRGGLF